MPLPAQLRVIVTIRLKYACRGCTDGVTQAPAPAHLIPGGMPSEAMLAHVLVSTYADHLPCIDRARSWVIILRQTGEVRSFGHQVIYAAALVSIPQSGHNESVIIRSEIS